jgi:hypothetical protein
VKDVCHKIEYGCDLINNSELCETYGAAMNETNWSILECIWIEGASQISDSNMSEARCVLKVCIL